MTKTHCEICNKDLPAVNNDHLVTVVKAHFSAVHPSIEYELKGTVLSIKKKESKKDEKKEEKSSVVETVKKAVKKRGRGKKK